VSPHSFKSAIGPAKSALAPQIASAMYEFHEFADTDVVFERVHHLSPSDSPSFSVAYSFSLRFVHADVLESKADGDPRRAIRAPETGVTK
jgi:hypothetical protein